MRVEENTSVVTVTVLYELRRMLSQMLGSRPVATTTRVSYLWIWKEGSPASLLEDSKEILFVLQAALLPHLDASHALPCTP